jgi:O-glycosyl hydrolase
MQNKHRILLILILLILLIPVIRENLNQTQVTPRMTQNAPANTQIIPAKTEIIMKGTITNVDPGNVYVSNFEGWGTSLAWWANVTGGWSDGKRNELADLIFSASGLGMNIVRYNIGGSANTQAGMRPGGLVQSYMDEKNAYDWTKDANQRWMLSAAKARGVNIFEAFSNSPPWFMTISGDARGADGCGNNLQDSQYDAFAEYLTEVVKHFRDNWGISFRTLEPLNESSGDWWCLSGRQEGAHFDHAKQELLLSKVEPLLKSKGLSETRLAASDETSPAETIASINSYGSATKEYIDQINTHTYGGDSGDKKILHTLALNLGKRLWMSEIDGSAGIHIHDDMAPGLWLAARVTEDINSIKPAAWVYWQVIEDEKNMQFENQNWGLIHADMAGTSETYTLTKKYYVMGNYTKYIRPGYQIIDAGDSRAVSAYDAASATLVIVIYNNTTSDSLLTWVLTRFQNVSGPVTSYRTSATENLEQSLHIPVSNRSFTATANANSVTTYVINGVGGAAPAPTATPTAGSFPIPGAYYRFFNRNSGKPIDVYGDSSAEGAHIVQWTVNATTPQQWSFVNLGDGYYKIINRNSGKALDVSDGSMADGGEIIQNTANDSAGQQWTLKDIGAGYYQIINRKSGKVLDVAAGSKAHGALIVQWAANMTNSQQWQILP